MRGTATPPSLMARRHDHPSAAHGLAEPLWAVGPARPRAHGPAPPPRWMPLAGLRYAHVVKTVRRRRVVRVQHRVVCGTLQAVQQGLAACGWQSNTAFIERVNLSI